MQRDDDDDDDDDDERRRDRTIEGKHRSILL